MTALILIAQSILLDTSAKLINFLHHRFWPVLSLSVLVKLSHTLSKLMDTVTSINLP